MPKTKQDCDKPIKDWAEVMAEMPKKITQLHDALNQEHYSQAISIALSISVGMLKIINSIYKGK